VAGDNRAVMQAGLVVSNAAILHFRRPFFQSIVNMIYIHLMNLNSLDLNLLVALDALLREANVSRAAMRIGLSQPATSHALQRLRDLIGDPLLVRNGARMELTLRCADRWRRRSIRCARCSFPMISTLAEASGIFA
jgi:hypothetical protein